jgi:hypothetical protein
MSISETKYWGPSQRCLDDANPQEAAIPVDEVTDIV